MTAELNEEIDNSKHSQTADSVAGSATKANAAEAQFVLPPEIIEIFEFLSLNQKIVFKSQQIDDPEMQHDEKVQIARDIYAKNRQTFLMRFGAHLQECHLETFARLALSDGAAPLRPEEHCEEMQFMLKDYQRKLHSRKRDVKNRRYTALQQLVKQGEYFSEQEMMKRAPAQYQELIGQYLSEAEKKQRDGYDVKNTTFSGILMHSLEKQQLNDVLNEAAAAATEESNKAEQAIQMLDNDGGNVSITSTSSSESSLEATSAVPPIEEDVDVPAAFRQQWGNFENEQIACSSSQIKVSIKTKPAHSATKTPSKHKDTDITFITAGERDLLRQEFIGFMHEQFLSGNDDDFDYTQVDDNSELDDLRQLDQDKEDAYFEESEGEKDDDDERAQVDQVIRDDMQNDMNEEDEESEDELDIYMSHLNQHHSLRQ